MTAISSKFESRQFFGLLAMGALIYSWYEPWVYVDATHYQSGEHIGGKAYLFLAAALAYGIAMVVRQFEVACMTSVAITGFAAGLFLVYQPNAFGLFWMSLAGYWMFEIAQSPISKRIEEKEVLSTWEPLFLLFNIVLSGAFCAFSVYLLYKVFFAASS